MELVKNWNRAIPLLASPQGGVAELRWLREPPLLAVMQGGAITLDSNLFRAPMTAATVHRSYDATTC